MPPRLRYRCTYTPLQASTAETAMQTAWAITRCPVSQVDRLDDPETTAVASWPFAPLTKLQAARRTAQELAIRQGAAA